MLERKYNRDGTRHIRNNESEFPDCVCGHPKDRHAAYRFNCSMPGCTCQVFEFPPMPFLEKVVTLLETTSDIFVQGWHDLTGTDGRHWGGRR